MAEDSNDTPRPLAEISHGPSAFEAFLDRNQKGIVGAAVLLTLVGAGWMVMNRLKEAAAEEAGAALSKAETVTDLQAVAKTHPDSPAAGSAQILLADKQWESGDQDAAIETLRSFLAAHPAHPGVASARASLASRLAQQGKTGDAEPLFLQVANDAGSRFLAPYALVALGDIKKTAGKTDEAGELYKRAQDEFTGSPFANSAAQHAKLLNFKMPAEIEAPPAPAPKEGQTPAPDGATLPDELKGNPLGEMLGGAGAIPTPPVEEEPAKPEATPPAPPEATPPTPPEATPPAPPESTPPPPPSEESPAKPSEPSEGESN